MKLGTAPQPAAGANAVAATPLPGALGASKAVSPLPSQPAQAVPQHQPPATVKATRQAAAQINEFLKLSSKASVEFVVDGTSDHVVVRVVDLETNQLIRQIPSEETLAISRALDHLNGLLVQQEA